MIRKTIFLAFALWGFWTHRAHAAEFTYSTQGRDATITLSGSLELGDFERFAQVFTYLRARGYTERRLRLNSRGGLVSVGLEMADWVNGLDIETEVRDGAECASACFLIFSAGARRHAGYGARIGVHNASDGGMTNALADAATMQMVRRLRDLRVPSTIAGRLVSTAPSDMAWLSPDELRSMDVVLESPAIAAPPAPPRPLAFREEAPPTRAAPKAAPNKPKPAEEPAAPKDTPVAGGENAFISKNFKVLSTTAQGR